MGTKIYDDTLSEIVESSEGTELDFKSAKVITDVDDRNRSKIAKNLVGFANRSGGLIVFGIDDQSREPEGKEISVHHK
ncbi:hypothetical protein DJ68_19515, partial [Halorubrum sp. C3]